MVLIGVIVCSKNTGIIRITIINIIAIIVLVYPFICPTAGIALVGFVDTTTLFCGSKDLLYATGRGNSTAFCTLSGILWWNKGNILHVLWIMCPLLLEKKSMLVWQRQIWYSKSRTSLKNWSGCNCHSVTMLTHVQWPEHIGKLRCETKLVKKESTVLAMVHGPLGWAKQNRYMYP